MKNAMKNHGTQFFLFLVVFYIVLIEVLFRTVGFMPAGFIASPAFTILLQLAAFILPLCIWLIIKKETLTANIPNMKLGRANTAMIVGLSFLLLPFMAMISALSSMLAPNIAAEMLEASSHHSLWVMLVTMAVTPAIVEEVVFRGYIQTQHLANGRPFWRVAVVNGVLFGVIHMNIQQFFYAVAMGIIFAYMVHYTRSIRAGILSHFFINGINVAMFYAVMQMETPEPAGYADYLAEVGPLQAAASVGLVALVFLPFLIILWRAFARHNASRMTAYDVRQALTQ